MTTILALSSYFKGEEFLREAKRQGAHIILMTTEKLAQSPWPRDHIDQVFLMPDLGKLPDMLYGAAYLMRHNPIDRIVALDEYDIEMAAILREHLRVPGLGITETRKFRDKLIMRDAAAANDIPIPAYTRVVNHNEVYQFMQRVPPPWVLKPRLEAGAMGIKRVNHQDELWGLLEVLGDQQSYRVLEQYLPGDVYHVDALTVSGETIFANISRYGAPPLNVAHEGGIFMTYTLDPESPDALMLKKRNQQLIQRFGLMDCPTHAEFIKAHDDGQFYFLEIAARVGGAHIADLVEQSTNINLWREWARLEVALAQHKPYHLPETKQLYGGLLVSLARQQHPDTSMYDDAEIVWRMDKSHHAGMVLVSHDEKRLHELLYSYRERFISDFLAIEPPRDKPTD